MPTGPYLSITPAVACRLVVTVTFDAQTSGTSSDWGSTSPQAYIVMTQGSTVLYSSPQPLSTTRLRFAMQEAFDVAASALTVELYIGTTVGRNASAWNVNIQAEQIKR